MYDELSRIESIYGSVAEYNRVMYEEEREAYEPSEEEIERRLKEQELYAKKKKILNGEPSDFAKKLFDEWKKLEPMDEAFPNYNERVRAGWEYSRKKTLDCMEKIGEYYKIPFSADNNFFRIEPNTFAICIDYVDKFGSILRKSVVGLDYDTFKKMFRDLDYLRLRPTMSYQPSDGKESIILTNIDLGTLRIYDLKLLGVETEESIEADLKGLA